MVKVRFGDGYTNVTGTHDRQTFVRYCFPCYQRVDQLFMLSDVKLLAESG